LRLWDERSGNRPERLGYFPGFYSRHILISPVLCI
jgi:hypothetical protein